MPSPNRSMPRKTKTPSERGRASRRKGKNGELEIAHLFQEHGIPARTGRQYSGDPDAPDVLLPKEIRELLHIEVKRCETYQWKSWFATLEEDRGDYPGVLFFRQSGEPWRVVIDAEFFLKLFVNYIPDRLWRRWVLGEER